MASSEKHENEQDVTEAVAAELHHGVHEPLQELAEWQLDRILFAMFGILEMRDALAAGHCIRVRSYCLLIADAISLTETDRKILAHAALLHDIGKIAIPEAVLWKLGEFRPQELELVQKHAQCTYKLLDRLPFPLAFADIPFIASCHHEKLDGSGFYRGLKGDEIPLLARVLAVANEFDNLSSLSHRSERMSIKEAIDVLKEQREHRLDAAVVDSLVSIAPQRLSEIMESGPNFVLG